MDKYKVIRKNFTRNHGRATYVVPVGEVITPTSAELAAFGNKLQLVPGGATVKDYAPPASVEEGTETAVEELTAIPGIGEDLAKALADSGIMNVDNIKQSTDGQLLSVPGIGKAKLAAIRSAVEGG